MVIPQVSGSRSVVSNSLRPHGLYSPWNYPGQNTGVGSLSLLQDAPNWAIIVTQFLLFPERVELSLLASFSLYLLYPLWQVRFLLVVFFLYDFSERAPYSRMGSRLINSERSGNRN